MASLLTSTDHQHPARTQESSSSVVRAAAWAARALSARSSQSGDMRRSPLRTLGSNTCPLGLRRYRSSILGQQSNGCARSRRLSRVKSASWAPRKAVKLRCWSARRIARSAPSWRTPQVMSSFRALMRRGRMRRRQNPPGR